VLKLEDENKTLRAALAAAHDHRIRANLALNAANERQRKVTEARRVLAETAPAPVSSETLAAARAAVESARCEQEAGAVRRRALTQRQRAEHVEARATTAAMLADAYRQGAQRTEVVLTRAIAAVAPRGLRVEGGRVLVAYEGRGDVPYAELSHGERWRLALDVAVDAIGEGGLLVVRQEAWEGLDLENRGAVAQHARFRKTVILTAEATSGEIVAHSYSGD
jgi:hypothetical protein